MSDIVFADGIFFNERRDNAPDYVLGSISIKPEELSKWLGSQKTDAKGYVRLQIKRSKNGKPYVALDSWKPTARAESRGGDRQQERAKGGFEDLEGPPF